MLPARATRAHSATAAGVGEVADAERTHDRVERFIVERHRIDARFAKGASWIQSAGEFQHARCEVDAGDVGPHARSVHGNHA